MWQYNNLDELYHYGILGMRWGVRRFQRKNGRLTPRGRKRKMSQDAIEAEKLKKKKLYEMSNDEIKTLNKRKELESKYKNYNKGKIAKSMAIIGSTAAFTTSVITLKNNAPQLIKSGKNAVKSLKKNAPKIIKSGKNTVYYLKNNAPQLIESGKNAVYSLKKFGFKHRV